MWRRPAMQTPDGSIRDVPSVEWARLEQVLQGFEDAWRRGRRPVLADHLGRAAELGLPLLVELAHLDVEYRLKAGEAARVEDYLAAYPQLAQAPDRVAGMIAAEY